LRTLVVLLILANLTLLGYTWLDRRVSGEGARLAEQVRPEKIRLLSPQEVAQLGPAKVAALPDVCAEFGPLSDAERARVVAELEPLALGRLLTQRRGESASSWWAYVTPAANRAAAESRAAQLKAAGIADTYVMDSGPQRYAVSLGVFRTEQAARAYANEIAGRNIAPVEYGERQQPITLTTLVIRDPREPVLKRLRELVASFPGADVRVGSCEKSN
jgi:hypothetical protein